MNALTDRQLEVLRFIAQQIEECGYPPTIREIGEALELTERTVRRDWDKARLLLGALLKN